MHGTCQPYHPHDYQWPGTVVALAAAADVNRPDISMPACTLSDFDYSLPPGLVAQTPSPTRTGSRLLRVQGAMLTDGAFTELPHLLAPGDLVVFNDTRVIKARLRAARPTGGKVELLLERAIAEDEAVFQLRASHPPKPGGELLLPDGVRATVLECDGRFFRLRLASVG
jgi:S-adenosylmethionine:tRNA ribosyltransferase-isomerase